MNYKETLFFIGKCLTISHEEHNFNIVNKQIKSNQVDWNNVVKVATSHYVFPALYCNLKRKKLTQYLPSDLVEYMKHITDLNRERNFQIIEQAKEINDLLLSNNITPIFLKGTGNLLEGLYEDIAERMVGDIDFIVSKNDYKKTILILESSKYKKVHNTSFDFPSFKHYPRLQKEEKIAAVEIHKELLIKKYASEFNFNYIKKNVLSKNNFSFLSYSDQLCLSIIAKQVNDSGQEFNNIALRKSYDVFLLAKKTYSLKAINKFKKLFPLLNNYLSITKICLNSDSISFLKTKKTIKYTSTFLKLINNPEISKNHHKKISTYIFFKGRIDTVLKAIYHKETRNWLFKRIIYGKQTKSNS
jgi:hypothetical protein